LQSIRARGWGQRRVRFISRRVKVNQRRSLVRLIGREDGMFNIFLLDRPGVTFSVLRNMSARVRELNEQVGTNG